MDQDSDQRSFMQKHKFTLISLFIILLAAIPLLIFSRKESQKMTTNHPIQAVSPTPVPLTKDNAAPTLTQTDTDIQNAMTQMDTDLKAAQVDSSQDTTTGL